MAGKFEQKLFAEIDISDSFFDSLKEDYAEFADIWFPKGIREGRKALVFSDDQGIGAFIATKEETDLLPLVDDVRPACPRLKISTLRLAKRFRGQRLGEGALGLILWEWRQSKFEEIYLTVFPAHEDLIQQLERFGFVNIGSNARQERVYLRSRKYIDYSTPYKAFPFIAPTFQKGGYLIVEDGYHDSLFPYSGLKNTLQEQMEIEAANGVSKVYVGRQWQAHYQVGEPVFIYRKYTGNAGSPGHKPCVTSYGVITSVDAIKRRGKALVSFDEFCAIVGNKSVFSLQDLRKKYLEESNLTTIRLLYCNYFGPGNNVNYIWLKQHDLWPDGYPADTQLTPEQCATIWKAGGLSIGGVFG